MRNWSLLIWVTQFGFSVTFPLCFFLLLANWLCQTYALDLWIMILGGVLGLLTTVSTVRSCIRSLRKEAERKDASAPPKAFNDHD